MLQLRLVIYSGVEVLDAPVFFYTLLWSFANHFSGWADVIWSYQNPPRWTQIAVCPQMFAHHIWFWLVCSLVILYHTTNDSMHRDFVRGQSTQRRACISCDTINIVVRTYVRRATVILSKFYKTKWAVGVELLPRNFLFAINLLLA